MAGSGGDDAGRVATRFQALKAEWAKQQKDSAPPIIAANQEELQAWLQSQASQGPAWPTRPILATPAAAASGSRATPEPVPVPSGGTGNGAGSDVGEVALTQRKVVASKVSRSGSSTQRVASFMLPPHKPVPQFVSWAYLKLNELAQDQGKKMFYTDPSTNETVPDSDDEGAGDNAPWEARDGAGVDYALRGIARELGQGADVMAAVAKHLEISPQAVANRVQGLLAKPTADAERDAQELDDVLDAFFGVFCRRCRIFNCRLHGGNHVRPHEKPAVPAPAPDDSAEPCGPECWRLDAHCRELMSTARQQQRDADEAAARRGNNEDSEMEEGGSEEDEEEASAAPGTSAAVTATARGATGSGPGAGAGAGSGPGARRGAAGEPSSSRVTPAARAGSGAAGPGPSGSGLAGSGGAGPSATGAAPGPAWTPWEESVFSRGQAVFGTDSCAIARLLGSRSCREVTARLAAMRAQGQAIGQASARSRRGRRARNSRKLRKNAFAVKQRNISGVFKKRLRARNTELWPEYVPCNCVGSCNSDTCSCHRDKNFCEKYCACSVRCSNRFRGCTCRGQCKTRACPCLAASRECDPDLCRGCAATCEGCAAPGTECMNMRLRMRQHLRIFMGKSTVQGWGAFLGGACSEDDFLGEYTGDLITQEEADRRGRIYDRMNNSYLFNLNEKWVLDARHRGNKFRFANHSAKPNCKVKLMMVDGDWRVAVYANRRIQPNEELFYDYRYDQDVRPDWAAKGNEAPAGASRPRGRPKLAPTPPAAL